MLFILPPALWQRFCTCPTCYPSMIPMNVMYVLRAAGTHQRSWLFPLGNQGYAGIDKGNRLASRVFLLVVLILSKGGRFLMEQPANSYLAVHPRMQQLFEWFDIFFCQIWSGAYAEDKAQASSKPTFLWSNDEELLVRIQAVSGHLSRSALESFGRTLVNKRQRTDGSSSFSGNALMKVSQYLSCMCVQFVCPFHSSLAKSDCAMRQYHYKFGVHLAELMVELKHSPHWKAACSCAQTHVRCCLHCVEFARLCQIVRKSLLNSIWACLTWRCSRQVHAG